MTSSFLRSTLLSVHVLGGPPLVPVPPCQQGTVQPRVSSRGRTRCHDCLDLLLGSSNSSLCFPTIGAGEGLGCSHDSSSIVDQRNEHQHLQPAARCGSDCCDLHPPTQQLDHPLSSDGGEGTAAHMSTSPTGTFSSPMRAKPTQSPLVGVLMEGLCFNVGGSGRLFQGAESGPDPGLLAGTNRSSQMR